MISGAGASSFTSTADFRFSSGNGGAAFFRNSVFLKSGLGFRETAFFGGKTGFALPIGGFRIPDGGTGLSTSGFFASKSGEGPFFVSKDETGRVFVSGETGPTFLLRFSG